MQQACGKVYEWCVLKGMYVVSLVTAAALLQGEPEFERLKMQLEDVKAQPRGLEGTFRTAAEMERHRAQLADAAIEEQLEVQTAFREHGARLQARRPFRHPNACVCRAIPRHRRHLVLQGRVGLHARQVVDRTE